MIFVTNSIETFHTYTSKYFEKIFKALFWNNTSKSSPFFKRNFNNTEEYNFTKYTNQARKSIHKVLLEMVNNK